MENENKSIVVGDDSSYFDGGYFAYIGYNIAVAFVTSITFGIAHPWMRCWYQKWLASHTVINGKRMTFDGSGGDLFVKYVIWLLLSYVTCGIYGIWMRVALKKWISEHTHFEGEPDNNSYFDGTVGDFFINSILSILAALVPFAGPAWSKIIITRWFVNHTVIDSRRLVFRGGVGDLFVKYLLWGILSTITCGIFALFMPVKYIKWETENTFDEYGTPEAINAKANYRTQIHTDSIMLQSGDASQKQSIRAQMINEANCGLAENNLEMIQSAIRLSDILKECGEEFSEEESSLIYDCVITARRLKSTAPVKTKSKLWVIIVAAIVAFIMFIGVIFGAIVAFKLLGYRLPLGNNQENAIMVSKVTYDVFYSNLNYITSENGCSLTEVASGVNERVFAISDSIPNSYVEISVADDGLYVTEIRINGQRMRENLDNQYMIKNAIRYTYFALGLGEPSDIQPDIDTDTKISFGIWEFVYSQNADTVNVEIY